MLNDLSILDKVELVWMRVSLCGVPPSPRECAAAFALGPTLVVFGGRGRTCHADVALFHLARTTRSHGLTLTETIECAGSWEHPWVSETLHHPPRSQGHAVARDGSCGSVLFGGHWTDNGSWGSGSLHRAVVYTMRQETCAQVETLVPEVAPVEGGTTVTIKGSGFSAGSMYKVRRLERGGCLS